MATKSFGDEIGRSRHVAHLLPESLTDAGLWFLLQASRITVTFHAYQWMAKFLSSSEWLVEDFAEFLGEENSPFRPEGDKHVSFYEILMLQMIWADEIHFSKVVDLLTSYLVDLIACAYRENPELVPSKSRFDLSFVRKFRTINDAIRGSALAEVERISRSGFSELLTEARRVTSCKLPADAEDSLRKIVKLRNEIVHKQGSYFEIIDSMFRKSRKSKPLVRHKPGDTADAEVVACRVVGVFEAAAIKSGIKVAATKAKVFEGTDVLCE